jgi:hypothetical protein
MKTYRIKGAKGKFVLDPNTNLPIEGKDILEVINLYNKVVALEYQVEAENWSVIDSVPCLVKKVVDEAGNESFVCTARVVEFTYKDPPPLGFIDMNLTEAKELKTKGSVTIFRYLVEGVIPVYTNYVHGQEVAIREDYAAFDGDRFINNDEPVLPHNRILIRSEVENPHEGFWRNKYTMPVCISRRATFLSCLKVQKKNGRFGWTIKLRMSLEERSPEPGVTTVSQ